MGEMTLETPAVARGGDHSVAVIRIAIEKLSAFHPRHYTSRAGG
jgi:hypothetical protein